MRAIAAFAAAFVLLGATASAQSSERWTSSRGAWSIDFESAGWTFANPVPPELQHLSLIMIPLAPPPDNEVRFCTVQEIADPRAGASDADILGGAARVNSANAAQLFTSETVTNVTNTQVGVASVADIHTTRGNMVLRHRIFAVPTGENVLSVQIDCAWPAALDATKAAEISAVLDSIAITGAAQ